MAVRATDGDLGTVDQIYFDDLTWGVRYLTVDTGNWLSGRKVLISPFSILTADWQAKRLNVALTKKQVQDSPDINTHQPVSRQHETAYNSYFGYPNYWGGPYLWGPGYYPMGFVGVDYSAEAQAENAKKAALDSHLRSNKGVSGYDIQATDGEIGHVCGFILDDHAWNIRYLEVATRNWWPGKKVLISPAWIKRVSWINAKVYVALNREAIQNGPEYVETAAITREYEHRLYSHYGSPPYWVAEEAHTPLSLSNA
jgi:hypothetical protein